MSDLHGGTEPRSPKSHRSACAASSPVSSPSESSAAKHADMVKTRTLRRAVAACFVGLLVTAAAAYGREPTRHLQATVDVSSSGNGANPSPPPILAPGTDATTATPDVPSAAPLDTTPPRRDEAPVSPEVTTAPPVAPSTPSPDTNTPLPAPPSTSSPATLTEAPFVPSTVSTTTNTAPPASEPATSGESSTVSLPSGITFTTNTGSDTPSPDTNFASFTSDSNTVAPSPASNSIPSTSTNSSSASADQEDRSADTPETSVRNGADTSTGSPSTDDRAETGANNDRSAGLSTEGIVGIAIGGVGVVALVVAFVRVGSSNRKKSRRSTPDFGSSTGSFNDVDSLDSPADSATVSANQKPSAPPESPDLSSSSAQGTAATAAAVNQSASGAGNTSTIGALNPYQTAQAISKPQSAMEDLEPIASESFVGYAPLDSQSNLEPARRSSRQSHVFEDEEGSSPILVRFSRRSVQSNDGDIPMLSRYSNKRRLNSPRDNRIPVLSRGSEESVDSIEDEEIEISI